MNEEYTHTGSKYDPDIDGGFDIVLLKETDEFWVTEAGDKYYKSTGLPPVTDPITCLFMGSIRERGDEAEWTPLFDGRN